MKYELLPTLSLPRRNPIFTNREQILASLHTSFAAVQTPIALCGLSGIGKTQVALEYAYRHYHEYHVVLWVNATSQDTLNSDILSIATLLDLPEKTERDQEVIISAVKRWLKDDDHHPWLLILDNVENSSLIRDFTPLADRNHILITTQSQALDLMVQFIELGQMTPGDGSLLLLRRAKIIAPASTSDSTTASDLTKAEEVSQLMGGLPLALDQAGAYIEETACGLSDYIDLYNIQHTILLKRRGGFFPDDLDLVVHSESVDTTLSLSFEKVEKAYPLAAEVLRLCAFLRPDVIPEEIIIKGALDLGLTDYSTSSIQSLEAAVEALMKLSLIHRDANIHILSIHPLMQTILKDKMPEAMQRKYAECAVKAVSRTFPSVEFSNWEFCQQWLSQALYCVKLIRQWNMEFIEAAHLLHETAFYLWQRAFYTHIDADVETLYNDALEIQRKILGEGHPRVAISLHNLALLYRQQGRYSQAQDRLMQALSLRERILGPNHPDIAASLNELGSIYRAQGRYIEAEEPLKQALTMRERTLPSGHHDLATSLNELGWLYRYLGKYDLAEVYLHAALAIREKVLKAADPDIAQTLNYLAWLYYDKGEYRTAEGLLSRALRIHEQALGSHHPLVAQTLTYLALLSCVQGKYAKAESLYLRALQIRTELLGQEHPDVAQTISNMALLYYHQGRYDKAEPLYHQAQTIRERTLHPSHPELTQTLHQLGQLYQVQGKYEEAEELYKKALAIREQIFGLVHPHVANCLNNLARLYHAQQKHDQAEELFLRALAIRQQVQGAEHHLVAQTLNNLAQLYHTEGRYAEAEHCYRQALAIYEKTFDPNHPDIASILENYGDLLQDMKRKSEAIELEERAKGIRAKHAQENSL